MVVYNFKTIVVVPSGKELVDIILSKTQRKTPTIVHPQFQISRIRQFYMRKVKFASQSFHDKLTSILEQFPILDDLHPFYGDLLNILYDKDHYKLALGQLNTARHLIDNIGKDYIKLLKYGDSLYRCKQLKRAALGRMCTLVNKQTSSLTYLEQVRQHLARLPNIDPNTRTLILTGYPNVGKSSFMNKITRANVEVQPYPFTTKSLFVGHTDYQYLRWQVIDTPGILDHPLEERNTIEMQSITALAHLRAAIIYMIDISEQCGYSIVQQVSLFNSIKPLFANKPIIIVVNKVDVVRWDSLNQSDKSLIESIISSTKNCKLVPMSNISEEGVMNVKQITCDLLLEQRVETKLKSKNSVEVLNRLHVAVPAPRDYKERPPVIPESVATKAKSMDVVKSSKKQDKDGDDDLDLDLDNIDLEEEERPFWERGYADDSHKKYYELKEEEWKKDIIPEIIDGKNIFDFIDAEILERLDALEKEEEEAIANQALEDEMKIEDDDELGEEDKKKVAAIRKKKSEIIINHRLNTSRRNQKVPKKRENETSIGEFESHLAELGIDTSVAAERLRSRSRSTSRVGRKRTRSLSAKSEELEAAVEHKKIRVSSRSRSKTPTSEGLCDIKQQIKVDKLAMKGQAPRNKDARKGEGDRVVLTMRPKHLFSGKRGGGKTDRR